MAPTGETRIQLCGRLVVRLDGQRVEDSLPGALGPLLFAYLVLNRLRRIERDELLIAVYGEEASTDHSPRLSVLLSKLRRVLGPELLVGRAQMELLLPADAFVDVEAALEALHRAESHVANGEWAEAWGRLASPTTSRPARCSSGHDRPWLDGWRRRLDDVRVRGLECFAAARLGLGRPDTPASRGLRTPADRAGPFRETGHRILMEALERERERRRGATRLRPAAHHASRRARSRAEPGHPVVHRRLLGETPTTA